MDCQEAHEITLNVMAEKIQSLENAKWHAEDNANHYKWRMESRDDDVDRLKAQLDMAKQQINNLSDTLVAERQARDKALASISEEDLRFLLDPTKVCVKKINAIKLVRSITRMGLKESKNFVESHIEDWENHLDSFDLKQVKCDGKDFMSVEKMTEEDLKTRDHLKALEEAAKA